MNEVKLGRKCSREEERCQTIEAVGPVKQQSIEEAMICGKRENSFLTIDRPTDTNAEVCKMDRLFCNNKEV